MFGRLFRNLAAIAISLICLSHATHADEPEHPGKQTAAIKAELFSLRDVRLLDGPFAKGQELNRQYLLKLDPDRLLSWFRREAGLEPKAPPYRGWESEGLSLTGHILGFYMSGAAMMVEATGDKELTDQLNYIVDELDAVQTAHGSGYMLSVPNGKQLFANVAAGQIQIAGLPWNGSRINDVFEPTYTYNKLTLGLYQVYLATNNPKAKQVLTRACDWFGGEVVDKLSDAQVQVLQSCEHGSLPESFTNAYAITGDAKYLRWARRLCEDRFWKPLAAGNVGFLTGYHANSNIPKFTGFENVYFFNSQPELHTATSNFWDDVVHNRTWVIGGNSTNEHFFDPAGFEKALPAAAGPESCNTVNMLRLTEALYRTRPTAAMMDYYERAMWNHILSFHEPERGMFAYYTTMRPGSYRVYSDEFDSMWCCVGTGLECPGKYGQMIFTRAPDNAALDVNLFIAAELKWAEKGVTVRQETQFPEEAATTLKFSAGAPTKFVLRIRHPSWVPANELKVTVNGEVTSGNSAPSEYFAVDRVWRDGDRVQVTLPMHLAIEPLPKSDRYVALLYGPIVLSGALGRDDGLTKLDFWQIGTTTPRKKTTDSDVPVFMAASAADVLKHVEPVTGKPLTFRTRGLARPKDVDLIPFYKNHYQRYAIYWRLTSETELARDALQRAEQAREAAALDARTIDRVRVGERSSEAAHRVQGERTNTGDGAYSQHMETHWRDAAGGWFSYEMKVPGDGPVLLACTYWGQETGARTFDISVHGTRLATQTLDDTGKAEFYTVETAIPDDLIRGLANIVVKFQARPGNTAGGVFDVRILRPAKQL